MILSLRGHLRFAALLSEAAYARPNAVKLMVPAATEVELWDRGDAQAYRLGFPGAVYVVFRGTQVTTGFSWGDIFANAKVRKVPWPSGPIATSRVHRGYKAQFEALEADVLRVWTDHRVGKDRRPLLFCGHSLGGALATLAASVYPPDITLTFGSPRVGDRAFSETLPKHFKRIHHDHDIAVRWPLAAFGYRHGGDPIHLADDGILTQRWGWRDMMFWPLGSLDHPIGRYREALACGGKEHVE